MMRIKNVIAVVMGLSLTLGVMMPQMAHAKKSDYVYRKRANWVKVKKLSNKQLAGQQLSHPHEVTGSDVTTMLQSIKLNKHKIFKKSSFKTDDVFSAAEAQKFGPLIAQALSKAGPNEVVNVALVHKRPYFILRNDYISVLNVYATDQGVHFYFSKIFAKLAGDYQQASQLDRAIRNAKSVRVSLNASEGQIISGDGNEIILTPSFSLVAGQALAQQSTEDMTGVSGQKISTRPVKSQPVAQNVSSDQGSMQQRLQRLETLKKDGLITKAEYKDKRSKILSEL